MILLMLISTILALIWAVIAQYNWKRLENEIRFMKIQNEAREKYRRIK